MADTVASTTGPQTLRVSPWREAAASLLRGNKYAIAIPLLLALLAVGWPLLDQNAYWLQQGCLIAVLALVVSGVNLSFGFAGELQLGQIFMFAVGAYLTMILASRGVVTDIVALMLIGGLSAAVIGLIVAIPSLRIGGWSLAMASFFLVILIPDLASNLSKYTGGLNGLTNIPYPEIFGNTLGPVGLYEVTAIVTVIWFTCYRNLITSRYGVVFRVMRTSPVLAQSLGYSNIGLKTTVYALGAFPAGVAGCLFGYVSLIVQPGQFSLTLCIGAVAASVLGGSESVYGIFLGAALLQLGPEESVSFATYAPIAYGLFLILAAVVLRQGVAGLATSAAHRLAAWLAPEPAVVVSSDEPASERRHDLPPVRGFPLDVQGISKSFGGVKALRDVTLHADPGQVTALIGSNGSGKTTLLNLICGYNSPDAGTIRIDGQDVTTLRAHQIAHRGVGRTFQTPSIPTGVSVRDVVASGGYYRDHVGFASSTLRLPRYWRALRGDRAKAAALLEQVGLGRLALTEAAKLPLGTRRLVEVLRSLCAGPGVVLLDEPASGLNEEEVTRLGEILRSVAAAGTTVILIEHNFRFVTSVSDQIHVLHLGQLLASGTPQEVRRDPRVIDSYLGQSPEASLEDGAIVAASRRTPTVVSHEPLLRVENIDSGYGDLRVLRGLSLDVIPGTIEVVLGRNGVGKTTLLKAIAGLLPVSEGSVLLENHAVGHARPYRRAAAGICLVQEGKRIFRQRTVWQNVMLGSYSVRMSRAERSQWCEKIIGDFPALVERRDQRAGGLSGGQQQMVALAQALASRPKVLLLDEPSAGLAPAIVDDLFQRLRALTDEGLTVLLVEQLAEKALSIADHVTVLDAGRIIASGPVDEFNDRAALDAAYFGASH
jgi:branched-chain amino acid transport system permease protein